MGFRFGTRGLYPSRGSRAVEAERLARGRMHEAQPGRMQAEAPEGPREAAVLAIAHDGVTDARELYADLPAPPGPEGELEERRVLSVRKDAVARDGRLAASLRRRAHAQAPVLDEPALERAGLSPNASLDERDVEPLHRARLELGLQMPLGRFRLGEHEEPRCLAVEPMDDEGPRARAPGGQIGPEETIGRPLALVLRRHAEKACGLVDDENVGVFVHDNMAARERVGTPGAQDDAIGPADHDSPVPT